MKEDTTFEEDEAYQIGIKDGRNSQIKEEIVFLEKIAEACDVHGNTLDYEIEDRIKLLNLRLEKVSNEGK